MHEETEAQSSSQLCLVSVISIGSYNLSCCVLALAFLHGIPQTQELLAHKFTGKFIY